MNGGWYKVEEQSDTAVIYVHGLHSDARSCWTSKGKVFWPDLFSLDERLPKASIYLSSYHTGMASGDYGIQDCSDELHAALGRTDSQGRTPVLARNNLIFICHSMGGVVARYMLEKYPDKYLKKNIGLCLIASPSGGSIFASLLSPLARVLRNLPGEQLKLNNRFLQDLDGRFSLFKERMAGQLVGAEAIEHRTLLFLDRVVRRSSAGRYFPLRRVISGTDHSSICKPESIDAASHQFLVDFIEKCTFLSAKDVPDTGLKPGRRLPDVLFDVYEDWHEEYYVVRNVDQEIAIGSRAKNVWISGPPGAGKTCATKRLSVLRSGHHLHVCMSQCGRNPTRERLLHEILESLSIPEEAKQKSVYMQVTDALSSMKAGVVLYIDEVASSLSGLSASDTLLELLVDLTTSCKQRIGSNVTIIVSSMYPPSSRERVPGKIQELFEFVPFGPWAEAEMRELLGKITSRVVLGCDLREDAILRASKGSPRYIKSLYRKAVLRAGGKRDLSCEGLIDELSRELSADLEYFK